MGIFNDNSQNDHVGHVKYLKGVMGPPGPKGDAGVGYELTSNGNYDIDGKRLTDLSKPVDATDAATKAMLMRKQAIIQLLFTISGRVSHSMTVAILS